MSKTPEDLEQKVYSVTCRGTGKTPPHPDKSAEPAYDQFGRQKPYQCDSCQKEYLRQIREGERTGL